MYQLLTSNRRLTITGKGSAMDAVEALRLLGGIIADNLEDPTCVLPEYVALINKRHGTQR